MRGTAIASRGTRSGTRAHGTASRGMAPGALLARPAFGALGDSAPPCARETALRIAEARRAGTAPAKRATMVPLVAAARAAPGSFATGARRAPRAPSTPRPGAEQKRRAIVTAQWDSTERRRTARGALLVSFAPRARSGSARPGRRAGWGTSSAAVPLATTEATPGDAASVAPGTFVRAELRGSSVLVTARARPGQRVCLSASAARGTASSRRGVRWSAGRAPKEATVPEMGRSGAALHARRVLWVRTVGLCAGAWLGIATRTGCPAPTTFGSSRASLE
mmetsp:Transcript_35868/g.83600  ORF Transcript_35868/g.83600 Transcript_35868/m.83600 type:complete len:279 (+) Transcript_35868:1908-2744(+)